MTSSLQTFLAVVLGAVLAALGGFAATQVGIWFDTARRRRNAALVSGEILAGVEALLRLADEASLKGIFADPLPLRLMSFARREIAVYDRNRELLFSLADPTLRVRLHAFVIRLSIPLDRLADGQTSLANLCSLGAASSAQAEELRKEMQEAFSYLVNSRTLIPDLLVPLQPLARTKFDTHARIGSEGVLADKSGPAS